MRRLIEKGLMFGNLVEVASPTLVARYNAALRRLGLRETALPDFHVDLSGFSPEVGDELGDLAYLTPDGANRFFILLTLDQRRAPLLNARFSTTRPVLRRFYEENAATLTALTAREAVAGELLNPVWQLRRPADLLALRTLTVEADTPSGLLADAERLRAMVAAFRTDPELWHDDAHTEGMIALAGRTGDILARPLALTATRFRLGNFHTTLFGGLYLFREVRFPFLLYRDAAVAAEPVPGVETLALGDRTDAGHALHANGLVEPLHAARGADAKAILRQRLDFMLIDALAGLEAAPEELARLSRPDLRRVARRLAPDLPPEFGTVEAALAALEAGRTPNLPGFADPGYFYLLRAAQGPDRDLVNQLLAEFTPLDIRQLFICNKPAFYAAYARWPERKRAFVAEFLARDYAMDKAGTRTQLYGPEPGMTEPGMTEGPWGRRAKE